MQDIVVPPLGESIAEASIKSLKKRVGEFIRQDDVIALLETDKVTIEITSPCSGVVDSLNVKEGDSVVVGALIAKVDESRQVVSSVALGGVTLPSAQVNGGIGSSALAATKVGNNTLAGAESLEKHSVERSTEKQDSPAAKLLMQEKNISRSEISGSSKGGRITKEDVLKFSEKGQSISAAGSSTAGSIDADVKVGTLPVPQTRSERVEHMSKLRQRIAQRLKESQNTAAILTTFNEINMTNVISLRAKYKDLFEKKYSVKLGFMSFFVRAVVLALKEFPIINAEIRGNDIVFKDYCDIGVAVGTANGLVVPVVRGSENLSMPEIEKAVTDLGLKAKEGKLLVKDMEGGTFTITNGGIYGSLMSTPILNPPQSAILGMHAIQKRPVVNESGVIEVSPMMYVALSYDHRIVDGRDAVTFLVKVKNYIEDPGRLLLAV